MRSFKALVPLNVSHFLKLKGSSSTIQSVCFSKRKWWLAVSLDTSVLRYTRPWTEFCISRNTRRGARNPPRYIFSNIGYLSGCHTIIYFYLCPTQRYPGYIYIFITFFEPCLRHRVIGNVDIVAGRSLCGKWVLISASCALSGYWYPFTAL